MFKKVLNVQSKQSPLASSQTKDKLTHISNLWVQNILMCFTGKTIQTFSRKPEYINSIKIRHLWVLACFLPITAASVFIFTQVKISVGIHDGAFYEKSKKIHHKFDVVAR